MPGHFKADDFGGLARAAQNAPQKLPSDPAIHSDGIFSLALSGAKTTVRNTVRIFCYPGYIFAVRKTFYEKSMT